MGDGSANVVLGIVGVMVLVIGAYVAGKFWTQSRRSRYEAALWPLAGVIGGERIEGDGDAVWMDGSYQGRRLRVRLTEGTLDAIADPDPAQRDRVIDIMLLDVSGEVGWRMERMPAGGGGSKPRRIVTRDHGLKARLEQGGLLAEMAQMPNSTLELFPKQRALTLRTAMSPRRAPDAEQFRFQLERLMRVAAIHEQVQRVPENGRAGTV